MFKHQFDRSKINHLFCGFNGNLVVSCESAEAVKPCKSALDHPSEWLGSKPVCSIGCRAYLNVDVEISFYILCQLASVTTVSETFPNGWPCVRNPLADRLGKSGIMDPGIAYHSAKYESVTVDRYIAFDALDFLIGIETVVTPSITPFGALRVKCHYRRCRILPALLSYLHYEFLYAVTQITLCSPFAEVSVYCLPFGEVMWKHAPLAAADEDIEHCFKERTQGIFAMAAIIFKEHFVYIRPLTLGQMCLIEEDFMHDKICFLLTTLWLRVFCVPKV